MSDRPVSRVLAVILVSVFICLLATPSMLSGADVITFGGEGIKEHAGAGTLLFETLLFEDSFTTGLAEGWSWLREDPEAWRLEGGALEIRVQPGVADTVRNALIRPAPDRSKGRFAIDVTVTNLTTPTQQFEQAGITWYVAEKPVFKLVKELIDGQLVIIPGRASMPSPSVQLRLIVSETSWHAEYRSCPTLPFLPAGAGQLPPPDNDFVSIQCYQGPADVEHWIRFDDFRITKLEE